MAPASEAAMRWMIFAAALLLTGCYESRELLLDTSAARQPIASEKDWTFGSVHARLTPKPNGWYDYAESRRNKAGRDGPWQTRKVLLNPLLSAKGFDVFVFATYSSDDAAYLYGLVAVGADGSWQSVTPSCDSASADAKWLAADTKAALAAGARIKAIDEVSNVCHFLKRETLFAAMRGVAANPGFWDRVADARKKQQ
jgi:hypothetical protein